ncbi:hypothetical protein SADUNF_Sadunf19G0115100 [Salix dunnii]|uniref:Uncharacterized protein n=1 Tax=Salix dunnii TaxID=1413687 RepID=A0A835MCZ5_9ROSI|nr:hypothetical protein SADUNF_Sadunf19G0115100 [Salix dunnii]
MKPESLLPQRKSMDRLLKFPMEAGIKLKKGWDQRAGFEKGEAKISFSSFQLNSGFYRVPLKPKLSSVKLVTLSELSQVIPIQLMQGLMPTQEDKRDWLRMSILAFHLRRASASVVLPSATLYSAALAGVPNNEVVEEDMVDEDARLHEESKWTLKDSAMKFSPANSLLTIKLPNFPLKR